MPHLHEKIDFTVSIFIVRDQKVLFILHKQLKKWLPIGGHIELDEDPEAAALREAKEESGLDVELVGTRPPLKAEPGFRPLLQPAYMDIHLIREPHWHIGMVYFARVKAGKVTLNSGEHHDIRWMTESDLEDPQWALYDNLKFYAREALKAVR
ncbi:MAG TPA: NUDIX domain-containing protein [bacterium]|nr:NUDIX domain-containing protein [bacterium]